MHEPKAFIELMPRRRRRFHLHPIAALALFYGVLAMVGALLLWSIP